MVMVANLTTAHAAEKFLRPIGAATVEAVSLLMIDPLHFELAVQIVPHAGFVGMNDGAFRDAALDE
jgi:hypothetical protein